MKPRFPFGLCSLTAAMSFMLAGPVHASVNSYRFLHVTIDTPWHIFLFLLMGIFAPFILMVVLMWRNSARKRELAAARSRAPAPPPSAPQPPQA